jgi:hypothetical protein
MSHDTAYRTATGIALATAFVILFLTVVQGLIGIEDDDPANVMYFGVLAIGFLGAIVARFRPRGLAIALFATAVAQAVVGGVALTYPNTASPTAIVILHGVFVALFAGSGVLFLHAARNAPGVRGPDRNARPRHSQGR